MLQAVGLGDLLVNHLAVVGVETLGERGVAAQRLDQPLLARETMYGSVALVRALVEVFGTPPGMLATQ